MVVINDQADIDSLPNEFWVTTEESIMSISGNELVYNNRDMWPLLYEINKGNIKDIEKIEPGTILKIKRTFELNEIVLAINKAKKYKREK